MSLLMAAIKASVNNNKIMRVTLSFFHKPLLQHDLCLNGHHILRIFFAFSIIFTARKRSLGQGNIFALVCHSVHGGWGTWAGTPPGQVHPPYLGR